MADSDSTSDAPALHAVLAELSTERVNERYADLDLLSTRELVAAMNAEDGVQGWRI